MEGNIMTVGKNTYNMEKRERGSNIIIIFLYNIYFIEKFMNLGKGERDGNFEEVYQDQKINRGGEEYQVVVNFKHLCVFFRKPRASRRETRSRWKELRKIIFLINLQRGKNFNFFP